MKGVFVESFSIIATVIIATCAIVGVLKSLFDLLSKGIEQNRLAIESLSNEIRADRRATNQRIDSPMVPASANNK